MGALLLSLIAKLWPYIMIGLAAVFGLVRAWYKGKADQKAAQAAAEAKARDIADQVDNDVGALPADKVRQELKTWEK
ncbi:ABC transporter permease [Mesorhizobium sp. CA13]|uniref:ABC transporter permease n=1 Tax=Mesorhizobium sp. CA13 TaxID=2876643 RepID=UPI001CCED12B|nr:ABC transporter permease [Mesorhizobium sp. CA13]MBZ9856765.1 ABC transporter permease [Mesorhizobium sp. CA13]